MNRILPFAAGIAVLVGGAFAWQTFNSQSSSQVVSFAEAQEAPTPARSTPLAWSR